MGRESEGSTARRAGEGRGGRVLLWIGVVAVAAVVWVFVRGEGEPEPPPERPPYVLPVTLAEVRRGVLEQRVDLTGTVRSLERSRLAFETGGTLLAIAVREADRVAAGQLLARLEATELELAVRHAEADLALSRRELEKLQAGERAEERERLRAERDAARAEAALAESEVARGRKLLSERILSESELDQLVGRWDAAVGRAAAAEQRHLAAVAGTRPEDIAIQEARVAVARAALDLAERRRAKTELFAPYDGAVVARLVSVGDHVDQGEAVLEVVDLDRLEVEVDVPEVHAVRLGDLPRVTLRVDERPGLAIEAHLDARLPVADERSRNFRGLVRLDAADAPGLAPGTFVRVALELEPLRDVLVVPSDAVRIVEGESVVVRAAPQAPPPRTNGEDGGEGADEAGGSGAAAGGPPGGGPPGRGRGAGLAAEWIPVRVLGIGRGETAVEPLAGTLADGDAVVLTGVDLAFPGAPLLPRGGWPGAPGPEGRSAPAESAASTPAGESEAGAPAGGRAEGQPGGTR